MFSPVSTLKSGIREIVIQDELKIEAEIRRFLFGEMLEDERSAFEESFIADEDLFERMRVAEDELIESYVRRTLSVNETEKFEQNFLTTKLRRARVAFTRTMVSKLSAQKEIAVIEKAETAAINSSFWNSAANFFKIPKFASGTAFALLILAFGFWFLVLKPAKNETEIVQQTTPTPTIQTIESNQNLPANENNAVNANTNIPGNNSADKNTAPQVNRDTANKNVSKPESVRTAPILALFAGTTRSDGKTAELNLPKNARGANLQLNLENLDYKIYSAEIVDPDGGLILKNKNLKTKNSKIILFVSAGKLQRGDYIVKLSALNSDNESESIADYTFRVNRK